ncbi:MAG: MOSC domain-containing protein [Spirochaetes bacterium]|nr:MOSC domain-containing protein [Spirochaetota bacterium]
MKRYFEILSINISKERGVHKEPIEKAVVKEEHGLVGDGHAGPWHRQVSLLAVENVEAVALEHGDLDFDYHTENITTRGVDLSSLPVGTRIHIGDAVLEITQIGKEDQHDYTINDHPREYVNIRKGVFAKVIAGAEISCGTPGWYEI